MRVRTHVRGQKCTHAHAKKSKRLTHGHAHAVLHSLYHHISRREKKGSGNNRGQETTEVRKTRATPKGENADQAHLTGREHETAVLPQASKAGLERDCCREEQGEEARQRGGGGGSETERRRRRRDREETEREQEETCQLSRAGRTSRWYATALPSSSFPL